MDMKIILMYFDDVFYDFVKTLNYEPLNKFKDWIKKK